MSSKDDMRAYYRERAPVYERVYNYSQRQKDLRYLEQYIPKQFAGRDVLEIAAGTGYWTRFIAGQANSVLATDVTEEALQQIDSTKASISTQILDAYDLDQLQTKYSGFFCRFVALTCTERAVNIVHFPNSLQDFIWRYCHVY